MMSSFLLVARRQEPGSLLVVYELLLLSTLRKKLAVSLRARDGGMETIGDGRPQRRQTEEQANQRKEKREKNETHRTPYLPPSLCSIHAEDIHPT